MKNTILLVLVAFLGLSTANAQVGIGTTTPEPSSILDVTSTDKGFLPPRLTTVQRDAITSPAEGLTIFNTTVGCIEFYNSSQWINICDGTIASGACVGEPVQITLDGLVYKPVESDSGRCWLDRNLGATEASTGHLYQWGRGSDGHQLRTSANSALDATSSSDQPGNSLFIIVNQFDARDWRVPGNDNLWQGVNGINNPCPTGYKVPTKTEWETEFLSFTPNDLDGAMASPLHLIRAGGRNDPPDTGNIFGGGHYWTSTPLVSNPSSTAPRFAWHTQLLDAIEGGNEITGDWRAYGFAVRCIKD